MCRADAPGLTLYMATDNIAELFCVTPFRHMWYGAWRYRHGSPYVATHAQWYFGDSSKSLCRRYRHHLDNDLTIMAERAVRSEPVVPAQGKL